MTSVRTTSWTTADDQRVPPQWLQELDEFLRIPSISSDGHHADAVERAARWVHDLVQSAGGSCEIRQTPRQPLVVGEIPASKQADSVPTVMMYGHFDVQPPGDLDLWLSPPFEPQIRDGWLYARGAADDKGNLFILLKAAALLADEGRLPVNVLVVCDGEEEILGTSVVELLATDEIEADACLIFDGPMPAHDQLAFRLGTRGLVTWHARVRTGVDEVHSGHFGGVALNAVNVLVSALAQVISRAGDLRTGTEPPSSKELESWEELPPGSEILSMKGLRTLDDKAAEHFYLRTLAEPAFDINGLKGGETALQKTVLPVEAEAYFSIRLAPRQDSVAIAERVEALLREAVPASACLEIERKSMTPPGVIPADEEAIALVRDAFERALGIRPVFSRSGGTIPIVPALARRGIPTILTGFDVPEGNVHAPNERLNVAYVSAGVRATQESLHALAGLQRRRTRRARGRE